MPQKSFPWELVRCQQMRCQQCDPFKADATPLLSRNAGFPMHQAWLHYASGVRTYSTPCRCAKPELSLEASWLSKFEPRIATVETAGLLHKKSQHVGSDMGRIASSDSISVPTRTRQARNKSLTVALPSTLIQCSLILSLHCCDWMCHEHHFHLKIKPGIE